MPTYTYRYPHPAVTADCIVFGFDGREMKVLLVERARDPYKGHWAFPGGFMEIDETAEECAVRELREETGLRVEELHQVGAYTAVDRDPRERVMTVAFYTLACLAEVSGSDDAATARWWPLDAVPPLAFDHDQILHQATVRLRRDIHFEPIGLGLMAETFTIADLQRLYESIVGKHLDSRKFCHTMLQTGLLREVEPQASLRASDQGELFQFDKECYARLKASGTFQLEL